MIELRVSRKASSLLTSSCSLDRKQGVVRIKYSNLGIAKGVAKQDEAVMDRHVFETGTHQKQCLGLLHQGGINRGNIT